MAATETLRAPLASFEIISAHPFEVQDADNHSSGPHAELQLLVSHPVPSPKLSLAAKTPSSREQAARASHPASPQAFSPIHTPRQTAPKGNLQGEPLPKGRDCQSTSPLPFHARPLMSSSAPLTLRTVRTLPESDRCAHEATGLSVLMSSEDPWGQGRRGEEGALGRKQSGEHFPKLKPRSGEHPQQHLQLHDWDVAIKPKPEHLILPRPVSIEDLHSSPSPSGRRRVDSPTHPPLEDTANQQQRDRLAAHTHRSSMVQPTGGQQGGGSRDRHHRRSHAQRASDGEAEGVAHASPKGTHGRRRGGHHRRDSDRVPSDGSRHHSSHSHHHSRSASYTTSPKPHDRSNRNGSAHPGGASPKSFNATRHSAFSLVSSKEGERVFEGDVCGSMSPIPTPFERASTATLAKLLEQATLGSTGSGGGGGKGAPSLATKSRTLSTVFADEVEGGDSATSTDIIPASLVGADSDAVLRWRSAHRLWRRAFRRVEMMSNVARQFRTLRDMHPCGEIGRESLKVTRMLGKGAFAIVEECVMRAKGGRAVLVAVKRLKPDLTRSTVDVASMVKEAALLRKLRNSHIVEFLGYGHWEFASSSSHGTRQGSLFIVEELIDGGSLKGMVHKQMRDKSSLVYRSRDAVRWLTQVAQGLKYLHRAQPQVIHRDLKLDNVLLQGRNPRTAHAKLADFGLSALVRASSAYTQQMQQANAHNEHTHRRPSRARRASATDLDQVWAHAAKKRSSALGAEVALKLDVATGYDQLSGRTGTLMYMAPEVYRQEAYNEKADVYSYSIIAYELLHRYMMISATDGSVEECQAYARRAARGFRPPLDPKLPQQVRDLLAACWHHDPRQRPSMEQVVRALHAIAHEVDLDALDVDLLGTSAVMRAVAGAARSMHSRGSSGTPAAQPTCCPCAIM